MTSERPLPPSLNFDFDLPSFIRYTETALTLKQQIGIRAKYLPYTVSLAESTQQLHAILDVIENIYIMNDDELSNICHSLLNEVFQYYGVDPLKCHFVCASDEPTSDGSDYVLHKLRNLASANYGSKSNQFIIRVKDYYKLMAEDHDVVVIDDFIGTGRKFLRQINAIRDKIHLKGYVNSNVIAAAAVGMKRGVDRLWENDFITVCIKQYDRVFSDRLSGDKLTEKLDAIRFIEHKVLERKRRDKYTLGDGQSEAAFMIAQQSAPNSNFAVLWWPWLSNGAKRVPILHRSL